MAILRWSSPLDGSKSAEKWFGSAVMPPNLRPVFLHDRGGAGGPQQLLGPNGPNGGEVGQPYTNTLWEYRAYTADGYLYYADPTTHVLSPAAGQAKFQAMAASWIGYQTPLGPIAKVCAVYKTYYSAGARYCRSSYGQTTESSKPNWYGTPGCRPGSTLLSTGVCSIPPAPAPYVLPFGPIFSRQVPVVPFSPFHGTFTTTVETTTITRPPLTTLVLRGPGNLGVSEACQALANELANAKKALADAKGQLVTFDQQIIQAEQNGDTDLAQSLESQRPTLVSYIAQAQSAVNSLQSQYDNCESLQPPPGGGPLPPPPGPKTCTTIAQCDAATEDCFNGLCVPKCGAGLVRKPDGSCGPGTTTAGFGAGLAWLLGIGAAIGAIFLSTSSKTKGAMRKAR